MLTRRRPHDMRAYVHLGFPKCASTSLQVMLRTTPGIHFVGKGRHKHKQSRRAPEPAARPTIQLARYISEEMAWVIRREIPVMPDISYDSEFVAEVLRGAVDDARKAGLSAVHVSDEVLSGVGLSLYRMNRVSIGRIAERLAEGFGVDMTFVMMTRSQPELMWAYYRQLLHRGYPLSFSGFLRDIGQLPTRTETGAHAAIGIVSGLMYDRAVEAVSRHGRVEVVPFEDVIAGQPGVDRLATAMGLEPGRRLPHTNKTVDDVEALLAANVADLKGLGLRVPTGVRRTDATRRRRWELGTVPEPATWRDAIEPELMDAFAASNARLMERTGIDLARLGYPINA